MALRFVIGRAGSGKTAGCLDEIGSRLAAEPEGDPLLLLVPEQATFQAEQALALRPGLAGFIRAQVFSFRRLAWRVMQETGGTAGVPVSDLGKTMLLQRLIHKHEGQLKVFHQSRDLLGSAQGLNGFFKELRRCGVSPDALLVQEEADGGQGGTETAADSLSDKLSDLALLYREYEEELSGRFLDSETYLDRLSEQVPNVVMLKDAEVWVDGFFGFTPQETEVLARLAVYCRRLTVTLCLDRPYGAGEKPDEFNLFHATARAMARLTEKAEAFGARIEDPVVLSHEVSPRYAASPMLAHLERHFENRVASRSVRYVGTEEPQITLAAAANRRAEVEGCAREMLRLVRDEGIRWRDLSVRVRKPADYADLVATVFRDFGIPYFLDERRPVLHHPLVEFIRSALEVVSRNWPYEAVFRCVKTDFLLGLADEEPAAREDGQLAFAFAGWSEAAASSELPSRNAPGFDERRKAESQRAMDLLENYVLAHGIQGYRWTDDKWWEYRGNVSLEDESSVEEDPAALKEHLLMRRCRDRIVELFTELQRAMEQADDVRDMAAALYGLLEACGVPGKLERWADAAVLGGEPERAREHGQVWDSVVDLLDQLVEISGEEKVTADLFIRMVDTGLESLCLGLVPPSLDQVLVGSMDRTRSTQKTYSFVLGANEGVLPAKPEEDGILTDRERSRLAGRGVELPGGARRRLLDEQLLLYSVLASPSRHLWISYPLADDEGKSMLPSEIIRQLKNMFPRLKETERSLSPEAAPEADDRDTLEFLTHGGRALTDLGVRFKMWTEGRSIPELWWEVYNWLVARPEWRQRLDLLRRSLSFGNGGAGISEETARLLYGGMLRASVSRMERYVACPFSQFVVNGLKLRERKVYKLEAPDIGQLFHAALSRVVQEMQAEQADWASLPDELVRDKATAVTDLIAPRLQGEILFSSSRYRYIARKLRDVIARASTVLVRQARSSGFVPVGLELGFGPGEKLPPLTFPLSNGTTMEIVGRIDRVDRAESEDGMYLRVIDYKSGDRALDMSDLFNGLSLQMLTYLDVVVTHAKRWLGREAQPAGVLYFHVHNPLIAVPNSLDADEAEAMLRKKFRMKGLVLADMEAVSLMDAEMGVRTGDSEIIPVGIKKDGTFKRRSSVATIPQWDTLRHHVRKTIRGIGTKIARGSAEIEPFRQGNRTACDFCSFKPVCQFDAELPGNRYRMLEGRAADAVWTELEAASARDVADTPAGKGGDGV